MDTKLLIELFGYLGSALVVVSMLMSSVVKLRVINMIGSIIFAIYALIIKSYPTALMNFFLVGINVYHLARLRNTQKNYSLFPLEEKKGYLSWFLSYYRDDIRKFFPEFSPEKNDWDLGFGVCCDDDMAGITLGNKMPDGTLRVLIEYSKPAYRDCSVGMFQMEKLSDYGIRRLVYSGTNAEHIQYVQKLGYTKNANGVWEKQL